VSFSREGVDQNIPPQKKNRGGWKKGGQEGVYRRSKKRVVLELTGKREPLN